MPLAAHLGPLRHSVLAGTLDSASCDRSELRGPMDGIWSLARYIAGPPITRDQEDFTAGGSIFHPVY